MFALGSGFPVPFDPNGNVKPDNIDEWISLMADSSTILTTVVDLPGILRPGAETYSRPWRRAIRNTRPNSSRVGIAQCWAEELVPKRTVKDEKISNPRPILPRNCSGVPVG